MRMNLKTWMMLQSTLSSPDRGVVVEMLSSAPVAPIVDLSPAMVMDGITEIPPVMFTQPTRMRVPAMISDLIEIIETPEVLARLNPMFEEPVVPPTLGQRVRAWWARITQEIEASVSRLSDLFRPKVPIEVYNEHRTSYI